LTHPADRDWRDEDPGLPIKLGPCSNGEYDPEPLPPVLVETIRRAREECERNARRLGMTRRQFLLSMMGAATTLLALDACTREETSSRMSPGPTRRTPEPGGTFEVPPEATIDPGAAQEAVGGDEFIMDIQGHLLQYDFSPATRDNAFWQLFPQQNCGEDDPRVCYSVERFMEEMFLKSDTSLVVLSALPIAPEGSPLSIEVMEETRRVAEALCRDDRVLLHAQALPNVGPLQANLDAMEQVVGSHPITAWKVFTHYPDLYTESQRDGWWLDDHEPGLPQVGEAFIRQAVKVGVPTICAHKGFWSGSRLASPEDIGPAARAHPEANFVAYHSGFEAGTLEGPYTKASRNVGVNRLVTTLLENGIGPNQNVYAEIGSTWWYVMRSPTQAAHVLGKLLKYVGEDNVVWGTDCLFYGSPQDQIQALRAFQISEEFQERYGYPRLTRDLKAKILGLNGARLYGVEPTSVSCDFTRRELAEIRPLLQSGNRTYGPTNAAEMLALEAVHRGWP
jgi:uncharacterized protein